MKSLLITLSLCAILMPSFAQKQGICGKVVWVSGNQMPGPDKKTTLPKGVVREIFVYEATTDQQTTNENGFYKDTHTKLVAKIKSKSNGTFSVKLSPGIYSVFVKEEKGLWANTFDGEGHINPVTVTAKNWTNLLVQINYEAAY